MENTEELMKVIREIILIPNQVTSVSGVTNRIKHDVGGYTNEVLEEAIRKVFAELTTERQVKWYDDDTYYPLPDEPVIVLMKEEIRAATTFTFDSMVFDIEWAMSGSGEFEDEENVSDTVQWVLDDLIEYGELSYTDGEYTVIAK